jgi:hypothetical protein
MVFAAMFAAIVSCAAPTLPLPPPSLPTVAATEEPGKVRLASVRGAEPHALIVVYNRNPEVPLDRRVGGAQADDEGSWSCEVYASRGDYLDVTQEFGSTRSPPRTFRVP